MNFLARLFKREPPPDFTFIWNGLKPRVTHLSEPAVRLSKTTTPTHCWIGGQPYAGSPEFDWPTSDGEPMTFLAQLDLSEVAAAHHFAWLPPVGHLAFFYDTKKMPCGFDPKDRGKWQVLYM